MSTTHAHPLTAGAAEGNPASGRRLKAVTVIAWFMAVSAIAFGLVTVVFGIVGPEQEVHAFHNAVVAALLLVLSAPPAIAVARTPERAMRPLLVLAALAIAGLASMILSFTLDPFTMPFVVLIGVLWVLRPSREALLPAGRPSPILLVLVLVAAGPLLAYALNQAEFQRIDSVSSHDAFFHWVETSFYALAVIMLGLLAAVRPAAHRLAAWSTGIALAVLGAASLVLGSYASALDATWAMAALAGSMAFVVLAEWESRKGRPVRVHVDSSGPIP
jgi:hypothetical protein